MKKLEEKISGTVAVTVVGRELIRKLLKTMEPTTRVELATCRPDLAYVVVKYRSLRSGFAANSVVLGSKLSSSSCSSFARS
jgi:hypothetical protein